jgi:prophage regulatory protein
MTQRLLRLPDVKALTGLSRSTIYRRIAEGKFPPQRSYGSAASAVFWLESEITDWQKALLNVEEAGPPVHHLATAA